MLPICCLDLLVSFRSAKEVEATGTRYDRCSFSWITAQFHTNMVSNCYRLLLLSCLACTVVLARDLSGVEPAHAAGKKGLCDNILSTHEVVQGETPRTIVTAEYPTSKVHWKKLWSLIKTCNRQVFKEAHSSLSGNQKLTAGVTLNIPAIPTKLDKDTLGPKADDPVLKQLCGCTADIIVETASTWLDVAAAKYPDQPAGFASNLLAMCNPLASYEAAAPAEKLLSPGQTLKGICTTIKGLPLQAFLDDAANKVTELQAKMDHAPAEVAAIADAIAPGPQPAGTAAGSDAVTVAQTTCAITWSSTAAVRDVSLTNSCPVYHNGCSGPSDALSYQVQLTPCCQAHDWCYSCGHKIGWTKDNCDTRFLSNLNAACDFYYPSDASNRDSCKSTANTMYTAVYLADSSYHTYDACPGDSYKLANTNFGFNPVYTLDAGVSKIKPDRRGGFGAWTNFALCPSNTWMNSFSARVEPNQYASDDTALNALRATCSNSTGTVVATGVSPHNGWWGNWYSAGSCPAGSHVIAIRTQVESYLGTWGDDTSSNAVQGLCSNGQVLSHWTNNWGSWSNWVYCPTGKAVCGFSIRIEQEGVVDDTAMNDLELACCTK